MVDDEGENGMMGGPKWRHSTHATGNAGEAFWKLTGKRNPYGSVGVVELQKKQDSYFY